MCAWAAFAPPAQPLQFTRTTPQWMSALQPAEREWLADQPTQTQEFVRAFIHDRKMTELQLCIAGYTLSMETIWDEEELQHVGWAHRMAEWADPMLKRQRRAQLEAFFAAEQRLYRDIQLYGEKPAMRGLIARVAEVRARTSQEYRQGCCRERSAANHTAREAARRMIRSAMTTYEGLVMQMDQHLNLLAYITALSKDVRPESRTLAAQLRQETSGCKTLAEEVATIDNITRQYHVPVRN